MTAALALCLVFVALLAGMAAGWLLNEWVRGIDREMAAAQEPPVSR